MSDKELVWVGSARRDLRRFPDLARQIAGQELRSVQAGLEPTDWKPMPAVGRGVVEIRVHGSVEHRVFYVAKFSEAVYVLHAFAKKSQQTSRLDIEIGRNRLAEVIEWRLGERKRERQNDRE